jgi:hypothetical protein
VNETESLVDYGLIEEATGRHEAAKARAVVTSAELVTAIAANVRATAASDLAVAGEGALSAMEAEDHLDAAAKATRVAEKVHAAATAAVQATAADLKTATARAHVPVMLAGVRLRIAAAAKGEKAAALMADAEAEFRAGTRMIDAAATHGAPRLRQGLNERLDRALQHLTDLVTEAQERRAWENERLDIERGMFPWLAQFEGKN